MSWIAINGLAATGFGKATGFRQSDNWSKSSNALVCRGSLVIEFDNFPDSKVPCRLLHYQTETDWLRQFSIYLNADRSISVATRQGDARCYALVSAGQQVGTGTQRLTYSWNGPRKSGLVSVENLADGNIRQSVFSAPVPLPVSDGLHIVANKGGVVDDRVRLVALSDRIVPVGPVATISAGAMVDTDIGQRPIEHLRMGDLILTKDHGPQPVRWMLCQELPTTGSFAPIRLRAPFFGLSHDIVVSQNQRVMISGVETEYNFGEDAVLIEARNLIGHPAASVSAMPMTAIFYQILLDNHECIRLSGAWADSLYIGHLAQSPQVVATTGLADVPGSVLPVHRQHTRPVLRGYERQALLDTLIA